MQRRGLARPQKEATECWQRANVEGEGRGSSAQQCNAAVQKPGAQRAAPSAGAFDAEKVAQRGYCLPLLPLGALPCHRCPAENGLRRFE